MGYDRLHSEGVHVLATYTRCYQVDSTLGVSCKT